MDIEDYERERAEKKLLLKLQEAETAVKDGEGGLRLNELKVFDCCERFIEMLVQQYGCYFFY